VAWGDNADAITSEIVSSLAPSIPIGAPRTGPEMEFTRRVASSVAALLNTTGIPASYPPPPRTPRPRHMPPGPAWYRALLTGWLR